nr:MAG: nonstructural protein [Microvirus sp.]
MLNSRSESRWLHNPLLLRQRRTSKKGIFPMRTGRRSPVQQIPFRFHPLPTRRVRSRNREYKYEPLSHNARKCCNLHENDKTNRGITP